jgi:uncharacterized protein YbjT (DUF2867 family)
MRDRRSLEAAFEGAHGVYSVQNPMTSGIEGQVAQGKTVADAAKSAGVPHLVYGSAEGPRRSGATRRRERGDLCCLAARRCG